MTSVDLAVEIAADPDRVRAALSGALAVWLRPAGLEDRNDGEVVVVTADEPVRITAHDDGLATEIDEGDATVFTAWTVEGRADRTTVVTCRSTGAPDPAAFAEWMTTVLVALAAHLEHFPDPPGSELHAWGPSRGRTRESTQEQAHARFLSQVGVIAPRQTFQTFRGLPAMSGTCLERRGGHHHSAAVVLLDDPIPGVAVFATSGTPPVHELRAVLFGDETVVQRLQAQWAAWLAAA